ncbi:MAG: hypothetical protein K2H82_07430 [Oscillospiraceae bacterium]|nr:hypothetical protein [Oscillospiraceae bacterium]
MSEFDELMQQRIAEHELDNDDDGYEGICLENCKYCCDYGQCSFMPNLHDDENKHCENDSIPIIDSSVIVADDGIYLI